MRSLVERNHEKSKISLANRVLRGQIVSTSVVHHLKTSETFSIFKLEPKSYFYKRLFLNIIALKKSMNHHRHNHCLLRIIISPVSAAVNTKMVQIVMMSRNRTILTCFACWINYLCFSFYSNVHMVLLRYASQKRKRKQH